MFLAHLEIAQCYLDIMIDRFEPPCLAKHALYSLIRAAIRNVDQEIRVTHLRVEGGQNQQLSREKLKYVRFH